MRLGHAAANIGQPPASDISDGKVKPKMRHLCKNMQKAVQGTATRLLAFIGIKGNTLAVTAPIPEGGVTRIRITTTTGSAPNNKAVPLPFIEPFALSPAGQPVGNHVAILPHPYQPLEGDPNGPFLHRVHRALMALGPWEGRIVAFVLGAFFSLRRSSWLALIDPLFFRLVGCGIGVLMRMFWVLTVLLVRAVRNNPVPEPEETTIIVYAEEVAPPYEVIDEKKALDAVPLVQNCA